MPQANQHKPLPPLEEIAPHIFKYWKMRKTDVEILSLLKSEHIDMTKYGIGMTSYKAIRKRLGLLSSRQQGHTVESIKDPIQELRLIWPKAGARDMVNLLFRKKNMSVPRDLVVVYFKVYEPQLVRERKFGRLRRRRFWAAGVNDLWAMDQHDKWKRYGLALHTGIDPFSGLILWLRIWWTNSNPKLICSYYLDVARKLGFIPLVTQSDPGSENYGIANAHTFLRQHHDPNLAGTVQHRWMRQKKNVKPEVTWSQLRRRFTPGFEDLIQSGVTNELYDVNRPLDMLVFRWLFIPFLQSELDAWVDQVNHSRKRADRNKILPHGVPEDIHFSPKRFGCLDFKVGVKQEALDEARRLFAPPDNVVFQLVPPEFAQLAQTIYSAIGSPMLRSDNIWDVYTQILARFEQLDEIADLMEECQVYLFIQEDENQAAQAETHPPAGEQLRGGIEEADENGNFYMGGLNNGLGLDQRHEAELDRMEQEDDDFEVIEAEFTDDESEGNERDEW